MQCILSDRLVQTTIWTINLRASDLWIKVSEEGRKKGFANFVVLPGKAYGTHSLKCKHYIVLHKKVHIEATRAHRVDGHTAPTSGCRQRRGGS